MRRAGSLAVRLATEATVAVGSGCRLIAQAGVAGVLANGLRVGGIIRWRLGSDRMDDRGRLAGYDPRR